MENENKNRISSKFQMLKAKADIVFDSGSMEYAFDKLGIFTEKLNPFLDSLASEIKSLPQDSLIRYEIEFWVDTLDVKIEKAKKKKGLSETGRIFLTHRKKLKERLLEIKSNLLSEPVVVKQESKEIIEEPLSFKDIFLSADWRKYIDALYEIENPVISTEYEFIGNPKKHKGVIASWIKELQERGKINKKYSRKHLAEVLNSEIKGLDLGKDGKTLDNYSIAYENEYKGKLRRITNLLP
ncbi:MAG TPA: hypothetical protein VK783_00105 [Bacteroidia bacterium]|jgi:hypothetical protein|nr:hypothetical protein [Bacteroidia bacterium]